jgi:hypothetical protein
MILGLDKLSVAQAMKIAEDMFRRNRQALGNQILSHLEARTAKPKPKRPRKRNAKTGEPL